jgi:hypothetical protein
LLPLALPAAAACCSCWLLRCCLACLLQLAAASCCCWAAGLLLAAAQPRCLPLLPAAGTFLPLLRCCGQSRPPVVRDSRSRTAPRPPASFLNYLDRGELNIRRRV